MKAVIDDLKDSFKVGYEAFYKSRVEAQNVWNLYHNRQYNDDQIATLENRGQPKETFNVIKMLARMLVGYYSTIVNNIRAIPVQYSDIDIAALMQDVINYEFSRNRFDIHGDQIKLGGLVSGLLCCYTAVEDSGRRDQFKRPIYRLSMSYVPDYELVLDPMSSKDDYSDARFLHRFRWFTKDAMIRAFGKRTVEKLAPFQNFTEAEEADYEYKYDTYFSGQFRTDDAYLVVHSVIEDEDGKRWSIVWHDDVILEKKEITYRETRWPYRVQKLHSSDRTEYYGIFREVAESQAAINQAIIKIQQMVNTEKVFIEEGSVENIEDFTRKVNRVNAVIKVLNLNGVRIEKLSGDIQQQYLIVDKALDRIQRVLGVNDSFLGMAYASDSGRKVKLQQSATIMSLRYVTARIEAFYASLGKDMAGLIKQYYTATQVLRIADEIVGERWVAVNQPMMEPTGEVDAAGRPIEVPILLEKLDPASGEPEEDDEGNIILAPVAAPGTDINYAEVDITIEAAAYNDEDERNQLLIETMMSGQMGQMLAQVNPAGFFQVASLVTRVTKTRYSPEISRVFEQTSQMLQGNQQASAEAQAMAQGMPSKVGQMSQSMKLPTNTNEEY